MQAGLSEFRIQRPGQGRRAEVDDIAGVDPQAQLAQQAGILAQEFRLVAQEGEQLRLGRELVDIGFQRFQRVGILLDKCAMRCTARQGFQPQCT